MLRTNNFKDDMRDLREHLLQKEQEFGGKLDQALTSSNAINFFNNTSFHPAKLLYLALQDRFKNYVSLLDQRKISLNVITWEIKECVATFIKNKENVAEQFINKNDFDYDLYFTKLSANKKILFEKLIAFYHAILTLYSFSFTDARSLLYDLTKKQEDYDYVVTQLEDVLDAKINYHPKKDLLALDPILLESSKPKIKNIWQDKTKSANQLLMSQLADERAIHHYLMSVERLVDIEAEIYPEYCEALTILQTHIQQRVLELESNKNKALKKIDEIIQKSQMKPELTFQLEEKDWALSEKKSPYLKGLNQAIAECDNLALKIQDFIDRYNKKEALFRASFNAKHQAEINEWCQSFVKHSLALLIAIKELRKACHNQTKTINDLWTIAMEPFFKNIFNHYKNMKGDTNLAVLAKHLEAEMDEVCAQSRLICDRNIRIFSNLYDAFKWKIFDAKENYLQARKQYYEIANQYYQTQILWRAAEEQIEVINELNETRKQLVEKNSAKMINLFNQAIKESENLIAIKATTANTKMTKGL